MAYSSYINMGIAYNNEGNFFNAIRTYELAAFSRENRLLMSLNNIGVTLTQLGLQKDAHLRLDRLISYEENGRNEINESWKYYANRSKLFRMLGKSEAVFADIEKVFKIKPNWFHCWIELGKYYLQKGGIEKSEEAFTKAIKADTSKVYVLTNRGEYFDIDIKNR